MNIANIASQFGTIYDRTLHTTLTLPYSGFESIAIAQNDVVTASVINAAFSKLYNNFIQLYRYSNIASDVIPISSIGFIGSIYNNTGVSTTPQTFNVSTAYKYLTAWTTDKAYKIQPSYNTTLKPVTTYHTEYKSVTSYVTTTTPVDVQSTVVTAVTSVIDVAITPAVSHENLLYWSDLNEYDCIK
jgi:hypothetical protein